MAQIFHRSANTIVRATLVGAALLGGGVVSLLYMYTKSPYETKVDIIADQPIPFSHEHHVSGLGIDCRYCHSAVESSAHPGMPATYTCMSCHSQIWSSAPMLAPVRQSLAEDKPIQWTKVHDIADFVYFNHAVHVTKGVGCVECHGRIDKMPLTWKAQPMTMEWCLECHTEPHKRLREQGDIFNMASPRVSEERGLELISENKIETDRLINCSVCHR